MSDKNNKQKLIFTRGGFGVREVSKESIVKNLSILRSISKEQ